MRTGGKKRNIRALRLKAPAGFGPINFDDTITFYLKNGSPFYDLFIALGDTTLFFKAKQLEKLRKFLKVP